MPLKSGRLEQKTEKRIFSAHLYKNSIKKKIYVENFFLMESSVLKFNLLLSFYLVLLKYLPLILPCLSEY